MRTEDERLPAKLEDLVAQLGPARAIALLMDGAGQLLGAAGQTSDDPTLTAWLIGSVLDAGFEPEQLRGGVTVDTEGKRVHLRVVADRAILIVMAEGGDDPALAASGAARELAPLLGHLDALGVPELGALFS